MRSLDDTLPTFHEDGRYADRIVDWSAALDDPAVQTELRSVLTSALEELPDHYRAVTILHDVEGLSMAEIAACLGITVPTAKARASGRGSFCASVSENSWPAHHLASRRSLKIDDIPVRSRLSWWSTASERSAIEPVAIIDARGTIMLRLLQWDRRRFLGTAALGAVAVGLPRIGSSQAGISPSLGLLKQVDAGALSIGYAELGRSSGRPVILLHGWPYDLHTFEGVAPLLASAGYRTLVPYLRGYGPTRFLSTQTPRNGQQSALAVDVISFMDALNIDKAIVAGCDWGARTANMSAPSGRTAAKQWSQ